MYRVCIIDLEMKIDELFRKLKSDALSDRRFAKEQISALGPQKTLTLTAELLVKTDSEEICADCLDLLIGFEAAISMANVRADGWFEQLSLKIENFADISAIMGERFLAYSFILNIQIHSLTVDPLSNSNTAVYFTLGDDREQTLSLGEFKLRVVQAMIIESRTTAIPKLSLTDEEAATILGIKTLLAAPLFNISFDKFIVANLDPKIPSWIVTYTRDGKFYAEYLSEFKERFKSLIRSDLTGMAESPFTLDLTAVPRAREAANRGDYSTVIQILDAWPGLLSLLHRSPVATSLDETQAALIGEGVSLLAEATEMDGRVQWAEELYRLGLQFVKDTWEASGLMLNLGRILVNKDSFGEAIGLLRRALFLGQNEREILPLLGHSFLKQGKVVAARALLERCTEKGYKCEHLEDDLIECRQIFDKAGVDWMVFSTANM